MKKYVCTICGFVYDEAIGMPDGGIAPGTKWADIPDSWSSPFAAPQNLLLKNKSQRKK